MTASNNNSADVNARGTGPSIQPRNRRGESRNKRVVTMNDQDPLVQSAPPLPSSPPSTPTEIRMQTPHQPNLPPPTTPSRSPFPATPTAYASPHPSAPKAPPPTPSIQDKVMSSAVAGTVELLTLLGGLTLSATGKIVAPPLHVTRTLLLPQLYAATVDLVANATPQRLQDWFRIVQSAFSQFISVLTRTDQGQEFRHRFLIVWGDVVDCVSSNATRQVLVDLTATSVKLGEALCTPEFKAFLQQVTILSCRFLEALSSGRVQQFLHDGQQLVWAACQLWADPQTITALAEVTAYLCYALEMEDAVLDGGASVDPQKATTSKQKRQERRKERDQYQTSTYTDRTLLRNPNATVEQAILSSLGGVTGVEAEDSLKRTNSTGGLIGADDASSVSSTLEGGDGLGVPSISTHGNSHLEDVGTALGSENQSLRQQLEREGETMNSEPSWAERARRDVNLSYLKQQISQRTSARNATSNGLDMEDGFGLSPKLPGCKESARKRTPVQINVATSKRDDPSVASSSSSQIPDTTQVGGDTKPQSAPAPHKKDDESSTQYFYRVLDDVLAQKRAQGVDRILDDAKGSESIFNRLGHVKSSQDNSAETVRQRIDALRAELSKRDDTQWAKTEAAETPFSLWHYLFQNNRKLLILLFLVFLMVGCTWFGLGCYGIYILLADAGVAGGGFRLSFPLPYSSAAPSANESIPQSSAAPMKPAPSSPSHSSNNEIVIRIVREVVHLDHDGMVLGKSTDDTKLAQERIDKISECVANAM